MSLLKILKRNKSILLITTILILFVLLTGCNSSEEDEIYNSGQGNLKVVINWNDFNENSSQYTTLRTIPNINYDEVTHTGARVEYTGQNASFTQSVKRETAKNEGLITFNIPATNNANLYTVAVHHSTNYYGNRALWLGIVENLQIPVDGIIEVKMDDINWIKATWYPADEYKDFDSGFNVSKEKKRFNFPIYVSDPFQIGEEPSYDDLFIGINGSSYRDENPEGWRKFYISNENNDLNVEHTETYDFQPFVSSSKFNLPSEGTRYFIKPIPEKFEIHWN